MQIIDALRTSMAAEIPTDIGATGFARFYSSGFATLVASCSLSNPAFTAGAAGVQDLDVTPVPEDTSPTAGTVDRIGIYQNSTAASGLWRLLFGVNPTGSPDITMANNVVTTTDTVQLQSLSITVPTGTLDQT
jgi:hypothetical protein